MTIEIRVVGKPRTKKTSNVAFRTGRACYKCKKKSGPIVVQPSEAWRLWLMSATITIRENDIWVPCQSVREGKGYRLLKPEQRAPSCEYNCAALFYRDARTGDATGFMQGLADLLEKRGVIENDKLLTQWDGTRLLVDRANPRVEISLTPLTDSQTEAL